ncbi:MAG TPA: hypothetical protein VLR89_07730, partial [Anaerolineaceae bacterium]|nr:hypothetical protein [Anaerolineaceae bacterium]
MAFEYLTNYTIEEARQIYLDAIAKSELNLGTERLPTVEALGRITSQAVYAKISAPHYNACAMDGISMQAELSYGASESTPRSSNAKDFQWV